MEPRDISMPTLPLAYDSKREDRRVRLLQIGIVAVCFVLQMAGYYLTWHWGKQEGYSEGWEARGATGGALSSPAAEVRRTAELVAEDNRRLDARDKEYPTGCDE